MFSLILRQANIFCILWPFLLAGHSTGTGAADRSPVCVLQLASLFRVRLLADCVSLPHIIYYSYSQMFYRLSSLSLSLQVAYSSLMRCMVRILAAYPGVEIAMVPNPPSIVKFQEPVQGS